MLRQQKQHTSKNQKFSDSVKNKHEKNKQKKTWWNQVLLDSVWMRSDFMTHWSAHTVAKTKTSNMFVSSDGNHILNF